MRTLSAPLCAPESVDDALRARGHGVVDLAGLEQLAGRQLPLARWAPLWNELPPDAYLLDGGRYRRRRHGCFIVNEAGEVTAVPRRAHWQPLEYNALHGGIERWFEPLPDALTDDPAWPLLLRALVGRAVALHGPRTYFVEAHMFRIDTTDGIGRPTPEGAHRDGVDLVAVTLVSRSRVRGGETRVFDADGPDGTRFTMSAPGTTLVLDDARVIHETTPIQPLPRALAESPSFTHDNNNNNNSNNGHRDTLVITARREGFQER
jgi:hypothetical protein